MLKISIKLLLWMTLVTGLAYPLLITALATLIMPHQAGGSMIMAKHKVVGSALIAQKFLSDAYFWPRPSAVDYYPLPSGGSNLGPTSSLLKELVEQRKKSLLKSSPGATEADLPADMLFASGSGLDPHISLQAALFQSARVAKARNLDDKGKSELDQLIHQMADKQWLFLGPTTINVLKLNIALDELKGSK